VKSIRIGVVGVGHLGRIHTKLARQLEHSQLVGITDPLSSAAASLAAEYGIKAFSCHSDLIHEIDAAIIAAPTRAHFEIARYLLSKNIHVFVEKPMTLCSLQAAQLVELADVTGSILQIGHVERFNPALALASPHIQSPRFIQAHREGTYSFRSTDVSVIFDLMIHDVDLVLSLTQSPLLDVRATGVRVFGDTEDMVQARLEFADGMVAMIVASRAAHTAKRTMQVISNESHVNIDFQSLQVELTEVSPELQQSLISLSQTGQSLTTTERAQLLEQHFPKKTLTATAGNAILAEQQEFVNCIREGRRPTVCGRAGLSAVAVCERIQNSVTNHHRRYSQPNRPSKAA
jgi:predicted dehydrogenase